MIVLTVAEYMERWCDSPELREIYESLSLMYASASAAGEAGNLDDFEEVRRKSFLRFI